MNGPPYANGTSRARTADIWRLILYTICVLFLAGIASGSLYLLLADFGVEALGFGEFSFRILEVCAIAGCIPLLAALGQGGWAAWGLDRDRSFLAHLGWGLLLGIASLSIISAVLLVLNLRVIRPDLITDPGHWVEVVIRSGLAAMLIAVIEEAWFRGALQTVITRIFSAPSAILAISAFYALSHFLRPDATVDGQPVQFLSGFTALLSGVVSFPLAAMADSILALFIAGVLLGILRARHGNIAMCIGVHAGWVFVIKVYKKFTYINPQAELNALVGQYDGVLGWLAAGLFLLLTLLVWHLQWPWPWRRRHNT